VKQCRDPDLREASTTHAAGSSDKLSEEDFQ
jgi:hypothetical protein